MSWSDGSPETADRGDSRLARIPHVQMTTISQDAHELARAAVDLALEQIRGEPPREIVVQPRLVARETTGPPKGY